MMKAKKKIEPQGIKMWTQTRGKKKKVTIVVGLASYGKEYRIIIEFSIVNNLKIGVNILRLNV